MLSNEIAKQLQDKMNELENKARSDQPKNRKKSQGKASDTDE